MSRARRSRIPFAVLGNNQVVDHGTDDITLEVYPPTEVIFGSAPGDDLCHGELQLINPSPLARFAFKVKSTAQKGVMRVSPVSGVVEPRQTVKVAVSMMHSTLGHRILVQSVEVPRNCADLNSIWSTMPWRSLKATKLDCVLPVKDWNPRRATMAGNTAVSRRVAQINSRSNTVASGGILVGNVAAMTGVTQRRRRKNVTVAPQARAEHNPWAAGATVHAAAQNDWSIVEDKENAAAEDDNAWGAQSAWPENGGDANGMQDNAADDWCTDNNAAAEEQNYGAAAGVATDDWGNAQNNDNNDDWGANDGGGAQVDDNAWAFDNNAAPAAAVDDGWAVDNPAEGAVAAATDNAWPADNNNALADANAWNNGGDAAWNHDNYSATAAGMAAAGEGRVIVSFKGIQDIVLGVLVLLFIGLVIGKIF